LFLQSLLALLLFLLAMFRLAADDDDDEAAAAERAGLAVGDVDESEGEVEEEVDGEAGDEGDEQMSATGDEGRDDDGLMVVSWDSRSHSSRSMRLRAGWSSPRLVPTRERR
jgi:hypothetical protein